MDLPLYEVLEPPVDDGPSTIIRDKKAPVSPLLADLQLGVEKVNQRMADLMEYLTLAVQHGTCRCSYMPSPNCTVCRARELLAKIQGEDAPAPQTPTQTF